MSTVMGQVLLTALLVVAAVGDGLPFVASIFSDNMVLQRDAPTVEVWGWWSRAELGRFHKVRVAVRDDESHHESVTETSAIEEHNHDRWAVLLKPHRAGLQYSVTVSGINADNRTAKAIHFANVAFGDVYLCGGQSNMQFTVNMSFNGSTEVAAANYPHLRVFSVEMSHAYVPSIDVVGNPGIGNGTWQPVTPLTVGGPTWDYFSGACYFFGRDLFARLNGSVAIGLLSSNYGGTIIEGWMTPDAIALCPNQTASASSSSSADSAIFQTSTLPPAPTAPFCPASWQLPHQNQPTIEYNTMIYPIRNYSVKAVFWWQGEQNANLPDQYSCLFPTFVELWRDLWRTSKGSSGSDILPFIFVIMEAYPEGCEFELIRNAQLSALSLPKVYYSNALDVGDVTSPFTPIHPRDKQRVASRAAAAAMAELYGAGPSSPWRGPQHVLSAVRRGTDRRSLDGTDDLRTFQIDIHFSTDVVGGIALGPTEQCWDCCEVSPAFVATEQSITPGNRVRTRNATVTSPLTLTVFVDLPLRSGPPQVLGLNFESYPQCAVYDAAGFPAPPFVTSLY